jgi:hypothetical protein
MFSKLFGRRQFVVLSFFDHWDHRQTARIGQLDPWAEIDPLYNKDGDQLYLIESKNLCLGHAKVFNFVGGASAWATSMSNATNVWASWDMGRPIGPFGLDDQYKRARHGAEKVFVREARARIQRNAAEMALASLTSG